MGSWFRIETSVNQSPSHAWQSHLSLCQGFAEAQRTSDRGYLFRYSVVFRHSDRFPDQERKSPRTLRVEKRFLCGKMDMARGCHLAANVRPSRNESSFDVYPAHGSGPSFTVKTLHISCKSDV